MKKERKTDKKRKKTRQENKIKTERKGTKHNGLSKSGPLAIDKERNTSET